jgi:hypothetical protein
VLVTDLGGDDETMVCKRAMAVAISAAASGAYAQCAGFTDVANDVFCPNVEWLKNRAITLGCNPPANDNFCPTLNVSRLAMAAFLNRAGRALTPEILLRQVTFGAVTVPGQPPEFASIHCVTTDTAAATYPRQALVNGSLTALADASAAGLNIFLFVSTNGGMSYTQLDPMVSVGQRTTAAANSWGGAALTESMDLAPNTTYRFALGFRRDIVGPLTMGNVAAGRCQLTASIFNRNGTSSPFDVE